MMQLAGKRVLLVAPRFFGYEKEIRCEIESRGAQVDWLPDRPFDTPLMTALTKHKPAWILPAADRLYQQELERFGASTYDIVLAVNGQTLSNAMLRTLRARFSTARFILYMWDSIENRGGVVGNLPLFDDTFTFDPLNAKQFGMALRPLFFSKGFERPSTEKVEYHLSFIGTAHTDRYQVVNQLRTQLRPGLQTYWYLYLQAPWVYYAYKLTNPALRDARRSDFEFRPLAKSSLQSVFARSLAVLDIEHPLQRGLTMRTFETMGSQKKLVTTNVQVKDYDIYDPNNICVIDRKVPQVPPGFLETAFKPLSPELYRRYSIAGWLDEVLSGA